MNTLVVREILRRSTWSNVLQTWRKFMHIWPRDRTSSLRASCEPFGSLLKPHDGDRRQCTHSWTVFNLLVRMSVLRVYWQSLPRQALGRTLLSSSRGLSTESGAPTKTVEKEDSGITPAPQRDIVTADVVSGAPGKLPIQHRYPYLLKFFGSSRRTPSSCCTDLPIHS